MEITIPKPLTIGPELTQIYLSGIFGIFREAEFVIDAKQNKIKISNACLGFSENVLPGTILIENMTNPGYVTSTESFKIKLTDRD